MDRADESRGAKRRRASPDTVLRRCLDSSDDEDAPTPSYEEWLGEQAFGIYREWRVGKGRPVWHAAAVTIQLRLREWRRRREEREKWIDDAVDEYMDALEMEAMYGVHPSPPPSPPSSFRTPSRSPTPSPHRLAQREFEYFQAFESREDIDRLNQYRAWIPKGYAGYVDEMFEEWRLNYSQ